MVWNRFTYDWNTGIYPEQPYKPKIRRDVDQIEAAWAPIREENKLISCTYYIKTETGLIF